MLIVKRLPVVCHCLQNYLEEMAAMLAQAQGDSNTPAGHRLQRLCTELVHAMSICVENRD